MFEIITLAIFLWPLVKSIGLMLRLTWGIAKTVAAILIGLALPVLILCFLFVGGIALLVPLVIIAIAAAILKACL